MYKKGESKSKFLIDPSVSALDFIHLAVKVLEPLLFLLLYGLDRPSSLLISFLALFILLNLKKLPHFHLFFLKLLEQVIDLLGFWGVSGSKYSSNTESDPTDSANTPHTLSAPGKPHTPYDNSAHTDN